MRNGGSRDLFESSPEPMAPSENGDLFAGFEVISTYTDASAVSDGVLVDLSNGNRATAAVFSWLKRALPDGAAPPKNLPVTMMGWFGNRNPAARAKAAADGLVGTHAPRARRVYEENLDGGIFSLRALTGPDGVITKILEPGRGEAPEGADLVTLWLVPNEVGGVSLLSPSDY